ncbi:MAG: LysM peptidoglycan-binding domain-containing protein [Actinomycetes bacterium]
MGRRAAAGLPLLLTAALGSALTAGPALADTSYRVQPGDTVSHIALRSGVSQASIISANGLDSRGFILAGQVLTLPSPSAAGSSSGAATYTVQRGDTVGAIAQRTGVSQATIIAANGLDARGFIRAGQQLSLPGATASSPAASASRPAPGSVPSRAAMQAIIADTARTLGVDPALAQAVAYQESGFNHRVVSSANAIGAMQVIPSAGDWASGMAGRTLDLRDPHDNATAGVLVLRSHLRSTGDVPTAVAAYYQGITSVRTKGMYADTKQYVANVQALRKRFA